MVNAVIRLLIVFLGLSLIGCATPPPEQRRFIPKVLSGDFKLGNQGPDEGVVVVSLSASGQGITGHLYGITRFGDGDTHGAIVAFNGKHPADFNVSDGANNLNGGGRLLVIALPSGTYAFNGFLVGMQGRVYNQTTQYRPTFSVAPESITYLGNLHTNIAYSVQQNGFVFGMSARDARDRDFKLLRERFPHVDGARVALALLPGNEKSKAVSDTAKSISDALPTKLDDLNGLMKR